MILFQSTSAMFMAMAVLLTAAGVLAFGRTGTGEGRVVVQRRLMAVSTNPGKLSDLSLFRPQGAGPAPYLSQGQGQGEVGAALLGHEHEQQRQEGARRAAGSKQPSFQQRDAIVSDAQSVLVVAGPGAGKTRVLSARMAYLLESGKCSPSEILALSYTNSAAANIKMRTDRLLSGSIATTEGMTVNTFHGLCSSILRNNIGAMRADGREMQIADDGEQMKIMMSLLESRGLPASHITATNALRQIRYWKELGLGYLGVRKNSLATWTEQRAYELYPDYQSRLRALKVFDFGDLLLYTLRLFRQHPEVLESYRNQFRHILVDEFQDVSPAQYDVLRMLAVGSDTPARSVDAAAAAEASGEEQGPTVDSDKWYANTLAIESKLAHERSSGRVPGLTVGGFQDPAGGDGGESAGRATGSTGASPSTSALCDGRPRTSVFCCGDDDQSIYAFRGATVELMRRFKFDFPSAEVMRLGVSYRLPSGLEKATDVFASNLPDRIGKSWDSNRNIISMLYVGEGDAGGTGGHGPGSGSVQGSASQAAAAVDSRQHVSTRRALAATSTSGAALEVRCMRDPAQEVGWVAMHVRRQMEAWTGMTTTMTDGGGDGRDYGIAILARDNSDMARLGDGLRAAGLRYMARGTGAWVLPSDTGKGQGDVVVVAADTQQSQQQQHQQQESKGPQVWLMTMHAAKGLEFDEVVLPFWVDGNVPKRASPDERRLAFVSLTRARERVLISYSKMDAPRSLSPQRRAASPYIDELMRAGQPVHYEDLSALNFVDALPAPVKAAAPVRARVSSRAPLKPPSLTALDQGREGERERERSQGALASSHLVGGMLEPFSYPALPTAEKATSKGATRAKTISKAKAKAKAKKVKAVTKTTARAAPVTKVVSTRVANVVATVASMKVVSTKVAKVVAMVTAVVKVGTRRKRRVPSMPVAATLTRTQCRQLIKGQVGTSLLAKEVLRTRLALEGVTRGSIPVRDPLGGLRTIRRVQKPLSRCSAEEMGAYLLALDVL